MIDVSQWRAAIGHWNSSRLPSLTPATVIDAESLRELTSETFNAAATIKPADINITADFTADVTHVTAAVYSASTGLNRTDEASTRETIPIYKGKLPRDTFSYAVSLLLYFMLFLLLSGDIELNPGPITVEQGNSYNDLPKLY